MDVGVKPDTVREACAEGLITMQPETLEIILNRKVAKGDVLAVAQVLATVPAPMQVLATVPAPMQVSAAASARSALPPLCVVPLKLVPKCAIHLVSKSGGKSGTYTREK